MRWAAAVTLLLASACAPVASTPSAASSAPAAASAPRTSAPSPTESLVTLTVGASSNVTNAAIYTGVEKGIYLKHGIDLKIGTVATGADLIKGLQGGQFQFTSGSWAALVPAVVQGVPIKVFAPVLGNPNVGNYDNLCAAIVRPGVNASSMADLKGLTIGTAFGSAPELWLRAHLKSAGLNPETDTKLVAVPFPNMLSVLQSKGVDVVVTTEPYGVLILSQVPGSKILVRGGGKADVRASLTTLDTWLKANPAVADRVVAAHLEASQYVRQHLDEAVVATSHYLSGTGLDNALLTQALKLLDYDPRWSSKIQDSFDAASADLIANGIVKSAPKTTDVLALDVLNSINTKYAQYFSDLK